MSKLYDTSEDMNFDELAHHFQRNIYQRIKGRIRLAIIERDLSVHWPSRQPDDIHVIDAGGGLGQYSLSLAAAKGYEVTLCDISKRMLKQAKQNAKKLGARHVQFIHGPLQSLDQHICKPADIILCHAVLEWMADPSRALAQFSKLAKSGSILSIAFFNRDAIVFKNLIRGNYRKVDSDNFIGKQGSLTPINPLTLTQVQDWINASGFETLDYSGIRVFHDYIANRATRNQAQDDALRLELEYSKRDPFRALGRYIHVIAKKI